MTTEMKNDLNRYLLMVCYHCKDAARCTTEEQCRACLTDIVVELHQDQPQEQTTEQLLREYAL